MVLAVIGEFSAACLKNNNQRNFHSNRIVSTRMQNNAVVDGTSVRRRISNHNHHTGQKNCRKFSSVFDGETIQWNANQSQCVVKLLRKLSELSGHLIKMRLQCFLLCLFLFCTHTTTLARPNAINNLQEANSAADADYFGASVSTCSVQYFTPYCITYICEAKQMKGISAQKKTVQN